LPKCSTSPSISTRSENSATDAPESPAVTEYRIGRLWCEACDEPVPAVAVVWTPGTIFTVRWLLVLAIALRVTPAISFAPATLTIQVRVHPEPSDRQVQVIVDGENFSRLSKWTIDPPHCPTLFSYPLKDLPAGIYEVRHRNRRLELGARVGSADRGDPLAQQGTSAEGQVDFRPSPIIADFCGFARRRKARLQGWH
jgi:hypothetical protein